MFLPLLQFFYSLRLNVEMKLFMWQQLSNSILHGNICFIVGVFLCLLQKKKKIFFFVASIEEIIFICRFYLVIYVLAENIGT